MSLDACSKGGKIQTDDRGYTVSICSGADVLTKLSIFFSVNLSILKQNILRWWLHQIIFVTVRHPKLVKKHDFHFDSYFFGCFKMGGAKTNHVFEMFKKPRGPRWWLELRSLKNSLWMSYEAWSVDFRDFPLLGCPGQEVSKSMVRINGLFHPNVYPIYKEVK